MGKQDVVIVGHSLNDTNGLADVSEKLIKSFLKLKYNITYMNISNIDMNHRGLANRGIKSSINILNANVYDNKCKTTFDDYLSKNPIDLVISIHDIWLLDHIVYSAYRNSFFWVAYQTFETNKYPDNLFAPTAVYPVRDVPKSIKSILQSCDLVIPCSQTGVEALENFGIIQKNYVPLGIDIPDKEYFKSLSGLTKEKVFNRQFPEDSKIFMMVGVNNQRKKIDRTLTAFAKFVKKQSIEDQEKYFFYLHSEIKRNFNGSDLFGVVKDLGIQKNIILEPSPTSKEVLYQRYSQIDCFMSLFGAEGFGLPFVEALLFNKPVIFTDYSAPSEYCQDFGESVDVETYIYAPNICMKYAIADIDSAVKGIETIITKGYNKPDSFDFVVEHFNWETNFKKLLELINKNYIIWNDNVNKIKLPVKRII